MCRSCDVNAAGGVFLLRLPDCLTTFTASQVCLLSRSFSSIALVKPFSSCAASGQRFLACLGRLQDDNVGSQWLVEVSQFDLLFAMLKVYGHLLMFLLHKSGGCNS